MRRSDIRRALAAAALLVSGCDDLTRTDPANREERHDEPGTIVLVSEQAGVFASDQPAARREIFLGEGLQFGWSATPGSTGSPIVGFIYAVDETTSWSPFSLETEWPPGEERWLPTPGAHRFFVRSLDEAGAIQRVEAPLLVFAGPRRCAREDRRILVVLDTNPTALQQAGIWPPNYEAIERDLAIRWLAGYDVELFETGGSTPPAASLLDCAASVLWIHSTSCQDGDESVLRHYGDGSVWSPLPSYVASGGNFLLCGLQPVWALRYFASVQGGTEIDATDPVDFESSIADPLRLDHWAATRLGVGQVEESVGNVAPGAGEGVVVARSRIAGANPYPNLRFDPLRWPGASKGDGFGYYDRGLAAMPGAEVLYDLNRTTIPIAVGRLTSPGVNGNTVYLGFHPYFVEGPAFREFVKAVLRDFGHEPL